MKQVTLALEKAVDVVDKVARDLLDPGAVRLTDHAGDVDAARSALLELVLSIKSECLSKLVPLGERHLRLAISEFVEHYHLERSTTSNAITKGWTIG